MDKKQMAKELMELIEDEKALTHHTKSVGDDDFIKSSGKKFKIEGIGRDRIRELSALYILLNKYPELGDEELGEILRCKILAFRGLRDVYREVFNLCNTLRQNGVLSTAKFYSNTLLMNVAK